MNKNPFVSQPTYTPPLPPGPPPPQPAQPDYSAYWAAVQQKQSAAAAGSYPQQWPAQPPRPPPEQNALYANYGYGPQNQWQRQQQQQQHPPPVAQPPPPPAPAPTAGYNPYQPAVTYVQPYIPQAPQAMNQPPYGRPMQPPSQPMFNPHIPPQPVTPMQQQQRHVNQHQPPAKRQRFDGPQSQQRQLQQQPPIPPNQSGYSGGRGGGPGSNQMPLGGRGGRGGNLGNMGRGRGGSMNAGRGGGGMGNRNSRGGSSFNAGSNNAGRGGGNLRGHNSRGHLGGMNHNRRGGGGGGSFNAGGGGSFSHQNNASIRGRGYTHSNRQQRHDGNNSNNLFAKDANATGPSTAPPGKKDENRRTLTDFKMVGLEIPDLSWSWGIIGSNNPGSGSDETKAADIDTEQSSQVTVKVESQEDDALVMTSSDVVLGSDLKTESNSSIDADRISKDTDADLNGRATTTVNGTIPHSRIRIYFHTPVSADDSHPIIPNSSASFSLGLGTIPSDSRKGKRKKLDDDEDGDAEDGRGPRPPPHMNDDRSSVAASVTHSVAESGSEADWLMAAITDGDEQTQTQPDPDLEGDEDDDERLRVSEIVEYHPDALSETGDGDGSEECNGVSQGNDDGAREVHSSTSLDVAPDKKDAGSVGATDEASNDESIRPLPAISADNVSSTSVSLSSAKPDLSDPASTASVSEAAVFAIPIPYHLLSHSDEHVENHTEHADTQVSSQSSEKTVPDSQPQSQPESIERVGLGHPNQDHLPEPPVSPMSNTLLSSTSSTYGDSSNSNSFGSDKAAFVAPTPSANRLSISYASGNRRMVINAEVVETMKIYRSEGRIEAKIKLQRNADNTIQGILVEGLSDVTKSYVPLLLPEKNEASSSSSPPDDSDIDSTLPPFNTSLTTITLIAYLDTKRPLSEPRWVRTGDIQDWLRSMFGRMFWVAGDAADDGWERKVEVVDPDPPPTIWTVLEGWAQNSPVGIATERQRFLKTHLSETENILEILLRLVRGERATAFSSSSSISAPSVSGPLLSALNQGTSHGSQQTHVSLAVLAIFQMSLEFASKTLGSEGGKKEVNERVGEIIRCLPSHLIYKSLDGIFKEWRVEKKGR